MQSIFCSILNLDGITEDEKKDDIPCYQGGSMIVQEHSEFTRVVIGKAINGTNDISKIARIYMRNWLRDICNMESNMKQTNACNG